MLSRYTRFHACTSEAYQGVVRSCPGRLVRPAWLATIGRSVPGRLTADHEVVLFTDEELLQMMLVEYVLQAGRRVE